MKYLNVSFASVVLLFLGSCNQKTDAMKQPELGKQSAAIFKVDNLEFKDLNKNGKLDPYEDWRLSSEERSKDLVSQMTLEEKAGMLLIADMRMFNEIFMLDKVETPKDITADFNEEDIVLDKNQFTGEPLAYPVMNTVGTTKGITQNHMRHFIWRTTTAPANVMAEWSNKVQALAEQSRLGIPVIFASNPRNHISAGSMGATASASVGFSKWPSEIGFAAMNDKETVRQFAEMARQEWASVGLRKGYMYMADLATEPRWQRIEGTFGEDPKLAAEVMEQIVLGFQGDTLNNTSIALTTKHFPGGGATYKGFDPHYTYGRDAVFPGNRLEENMLPFKAAIKAGTSSIMPYYSLPKDTKYEEVAYAYNKGILRDLLREELGFKGIINSDTGPIESMPWGVDSLTIEKRYVKALEAGINLFAGNADPSLLIKTLKAHPEVMPLVDESVELLLKELFDLRLFENPYVDVENATKTVGKADFVAAGKEAQRKSVVLLRNEQKQLPLAKGTKVYFEDYQKTYGKVDALAGKVFDKTYDGITFVKTPEEADVILLWIKPAIRPLFPSDSSPLKVNLSNCAINVDYVNKLTAKKPTILAVNFANPFVIDEIYNDNTKDRFVGVIGTFGISEDALLDVVSGKFKPTGKMPFTTPISQQAVETNKEDVPGYDEGPDYPLFKFGEGLSY